MNQGIRNGSWQGIAALGLIVALAGCSHHTSTGNQVTIQELMATTIDPSADALWASVSTVITQAGTDEKQPHSDEEWQAAKHLAQNLIDSANSLALPKQRVAPVGHSTEDSTVPGIEKPDNIQKAIDQDPESFTRASLRLRDAGLSALAAIDQKSAQGLITAGGDLDAACEACHLKYWYPNSPRPPTSFETDSDNATKPSTVLDNPSKIFVFAFDPADLPGYVPQPLRADGFRDQYPPEEFPSFLFGLPGFDFGHFGW